MHPTWIGVVDDAVIGTVILVGLFIYGKFLR